jgi:single-strand DNA-binding protein
MPGRYGHQRCCDLISAEIDRLAVVIGDRPVQPGPDLWAMELPVLIQHVGQIHRCRLGSHGDADVPGADIPLVPGAHAVPAAGHYVVKRPGEPAERLCDQPQPPRPTGGPGVRGRRQARPPAPRLRLPAEFRAELRAAVAHGDNHTTIVGKLVEDPEIRFTNNGIAVTNLRVAVTHRIQQDGQWRDGDTSFLKVNVWRGQAENLAESLGKGDRVMVTGRLRQRSWETPEGDKRSVTELEADEVGASLRWATAKVERTNQRGNGQPQRLR